MNPLEQYDSSVKFSDQFYQSSNSEHNEFENYEEEGKDRDTKSQKTQPLLQKQNTQIIEKEQIVQYEYLLQNQDIPDQLPLSCTLLQKQNTQIIKEQHIVQYEYLLQNQDIPDQLSLSWALFQKQNSFIIEEEQIEQNVQDSPPLSQALLQEQNSFIIQEQNSFIIEEEQIEQNEQFLQIQDIQDSPPHSYGPQTQQSTRQIQKSKTAKNLPIIMSKHLANHLAQLANMDQNIQTIREQRAIQQLKNFIKKDNNKSQKSYGISDIRRLCLFYRQNNRIVYKYLKNKFYMNLLLSVKVENPVDYIDHINWYLRMVKKPRLMRNNLRKL